MLDKNSALAVGRLVELLDSPTESIRLAAAREVLDRVYGKPKVSVDVQTTDVSQIHLQLLQEAQRRREERLKTIEAAIEEPMPATHTESPGTMTTIEDLI